MQLRKQNGITLITLVITIVILLIISIVSMNFILGENGIITRTQEARKMWEIEGTKEKLEMEKITALTEGLGQTNIEDYFENLIEGGLIEEEIEENEDGSYNVITNDGFVFEVTPIPEKDKIKDIEIEYVGEATGPRIRNIEIMTTTNSAEIKVTAVNTENGKYIYEYKQEGEKEWKKIDGVDGNTCSIKNLEENKIYNLQISITVSSGNNAGTTKRKTSFITRKMPEGAISFEEVVWQGNGKASVIIKTSQEGYKIQYQVVQQGTNIEEIEEGQWKEIENGKSITELEHNQVVYARLYDGNNGSSYASVNVKDEIQPQVNIESSKITTNSVTLTVEAIDGESGLAEEGTYQYYLNKEITSVATTTANSYNYTGLTQGTEYTLRVVVTDKAGNTTEKSTSVTTSTLPGGESAIEKGEITFGETTWNNNQANVTVSTNTGNTIQYQVNNTSGTWTTIDNGGIIRGRQHGDTIYARLTDGNNYGSYASVSIKDMTKPEAASISLSGTSTTTEGNIKATVRLKDNESGVNITGSKWVYNRTSGNIGTNTESYTGGNFSQSSQSITLKATSPGTYYLHVLTIDKAGNAIETKSKAITVTQLVTSVSVSPTAITLEEGTTKQLTASTNPSTANNRNVTWSSNNSAIASVSSSGLITAKTAGSAVITAKAADGSGKTATCNVTVTSSKTIEKMLKEGKYVNYVDAKGIIRECVVLYGPENKNHASYGIQIIAMQKVEDVNLGDSNNFTNAMNSYNNAINTLNTRANAYRNTTYSDKARCVGSNPANPNLDNPGMYSRNSSDSWFSNYNNKFKNADDNYELDWSQINNLTIQNIRDSYWLASRKIGTFSASSDFYVMCVDRWGDMDNDSDVYICRTARRTSEMNSIDHTFGLRPVFHLKSGIKVTGGNGTSDNPYTLGT